MHVKLIAHTPEPEKVVAAAAKLCYSNTDIDTLMDGLTPEAVHKFLGHLSDLGHSSPTEHAVFTFAVEGVSRALLAQLTRHRIASHCVAGDTVVGYNERTRGMTIKGLCDKSPQYMHMTKLRSADEDTKELVQNYVVDAWSCGKKQLYAVETEDGYKIKTTNEHRFLTESGWKMLKELSQGDVVYTNGVPAYQSRDWLKSNYIDKKLSQTEIGDMCGVSHHTVRAWVRKFKLQKKRGSWCIGKEPPNKGKTKETYAPLLAASQKMKGNTHCSNRVYNLNETPKTISGGYFVTHRKNCKTGVCAICGTKGYTELHHKDRNPKNWDPENVIELCLICHKRAHHKDSVMAIKPSIIKSIRNVGEGETYDVEMTAPYNNYVANGFIVHNSVQSQRYVRDQSMEYVTPGTISENQKSKELFDDTIQTIYSSYDTLVSAIEDSETTRLVSEGFSPADAKKKASKIANEDARFVLPNAACTKIIFTMNARELNSFFNLRCCNRAQWEIRDLAEAMLKLVYPIAPDLFAKAGPGCVCGNCTEGSMSCGKADEMREKYREIKSGRKI